MSETTYELNPRPDDDPGGRNEVNRDGSISVEFLLSLLDSLDDPIFIKDEEHRWVYLNKKSCDLIGRPLSFLLGKSDYDVFPPEQAAVFWEKDTQVLNTGKPHVNEEIITWQNGPEMISTKKSLYVDPSSGRRYIVGTIRNITAQKCAEQEQETYRETLEHEVRNRTQALDQSLAALRVSEEQYRSLVENINDVIFTVDLTGTIRYVSPVVEKTLGYKSEDMQGRPFREYIHSEDLPGLLESMERTLDGKLEPYEFRIRTQDGSVRHVRTSSRVIHQDGQPTGLTGVMADLTERVRDEEQKSALREQLFQSQKLEAVGQLAGGIAHDFNNMLTIIMGNAGLGLSRTDAAQPGHREFQVIHNAAGMARELTLKLLTLARRDTLDVRPVALDDVLNHLVSLVERIFMKQVRVIVDVQGSLFIKADHNQIIQALLNICKNAAEAMPEGGDLRITCREQIHGPERREFQGPWCRIDIADTGIGVPDQYLNRLTEPFFTTKGAGQGTGLGLSVAFSIIDTHGGDLCIRSSVGNGTTVSVLLPLIEDKPAPAPPITNSTIPTGKETILVVDDEPDVLDTVCDILTDLGYSVLCADSGPRALDMFAAHTNQVDLVVLDMIMPGMDGRRVFEQLRQGNPAVKILLATGYTLDGQVDETLKQGINGFVQKPFSLEGLSCEVRRALDES